MKHPLNPPTVQQNTQLQYSPYANINMATNTPVQQSHQPIRSQYETQNVDEYLLHAEMPLSSGDTYVLPHTQQNDEFEFLT